MFVSSVCCTVAPRVRQTQTINSVPSAQTARVDSAQLVVCLLRDPTGMTDYPTSKAEQKQQRRWEQQTGHQIATQEDGTRAEFFMLFSGLSNFAAALHQTSLTLLVESLIAADCRDAETFHRLPFKCFVSNHNIPISHSIFVERSISTS